MDYFKYALSDDCLPDFFDGKSFPPFSDLVLPVVDHRCLPYISDMFAGYKSGLFESVYSQIRSVLKPRLEEHDNFVILSLSGGVDSMVHLQMLLHMRDVEKVPLKIGAVHIRHSNRSCSIAGDEVAWVQYTCGKLGVPLWVHEVEARRPRKPASESGSTEGSSVVGSEPETALDYDRSDFEKLTRMIRYRMYRLGFSELRKLHATNTEAGCTGVGSNSSLVVIGHHIDDVDENRLAELGKGNIISINGMGEVQEYWENEDSPNESEHSPNESEDSPNEVEALPCELGSVTNGLESIETPHSSIRRIVFCRPVVNTFRKEELRVIATELRIPYMKNSTPEWSRRGWIRKVLDSYMRQECLRLPADAAPTIMRCSETGKRMFELMSLAGTMSEDLAERLRHSVSSLKSTEIRTFSGNKLLVLDSTSFTNPKQSLSDSVLPRSELQELVPVCELAVLWNGIVERFLTVNPQTDPSHKCPIERIDPKLGSVSFAFTLLCFVFRNGLFSSAVRHVLKNSFPTWSSSEGSEKQSRSVAKPSLKTLRQLQDILPSKSSVLFALTPAVTCAKVYVERLEKSVLIFDQSSKRDMRDLVKREFGGKIDNFSRYVVKELPDLEW